MKYKDTAEHRAKRINRFDLRLLMLLTALILVTALHLRDQGTPTKAARAVIMIEIEHTEKEPPMPVLHDSVELYSFKAEVIGVSENRILILADGSSTERGFLIGGAKYLFPNQPLFLKTDKGYLKGEIESTLACAHIKEKARRANAPTNRILKSRAGI